MPRKQFRKKRFNKRRRHNYQGTVMGIKDGSGGPIANLAKSGGFWGKVARVAITTIRAAGEIKRYALGPLTYTIVSNPIDSLGGPDYVIGSWYVRIFNEGLAQGDKQEDRQGNKIHVKGIKLNFRALNQVTDNSNHLRVMVIRMQRNFTNDADPAASSPLPDDLLGFPKHREVQVLYDESIVLSQNGTSNEATSRMVYREIKQPTFYPDDTSGEPDKGTIYVAWRCSQTSPGVQAFFQTQLTYHNME